MPAKQVQFRRGSTSDHSTFTGAVGEITVDTTKNTAVVHDGATAGGHPVARAGANTDITSVELNQTGLKIKGATTNKLVIKPDETLGAERTLSIVTGDADRSLTFTGDASIEGTNTGDQDLSGYVPTTTTVNGYALSGDITIPTGNIYRNRIINGAMMVSQQTGTTAGTTTGYYPVDQFQNTHTHDGAISVAQVASVTPGGSPNRIRLSVTSADASIAAGQYQYLETKVEGLRIADALFGSASAKAVIIRFGWKSPAGTYCVAVQNSAATRSYVAEFTISAGQANTDTVQTIVIPGDTTGTWLTDTGIGLRLAWAVAGGSTYRTTADTWAAGNYFATSSISNGLSSTSNVFELFDVGLYVDHDDLGIAPSWESPDFADDLRACQRYWRKSYQYADAPGTATTDGAANLGVGTATTGTLVFSVFLTEPMRVAPTVTLYDMAGTSGKIRRASSDGRTGAASMVSESGFRVYSSDTLSANNIIAHYVADARL